MNHVYLAMLLGLSACNRVPTPAAPAEMIYLPPAHHYQAAPKYHHKPVTQADVDRAIDHLIKRLHEMQENEPGDQQ